MTQANKPFTFTNGQTADATQVNSDFDTLYTDINGNLDESNIKDGTLSTAIAQEGVTPAQTKGIPYAIDLFTRSFLLSGGLPTADDTNLAQIDVPAYVAYVLQTDGSLRRITTTATTFSVGTANGTYYLDLNPDGTFNWSGTHSTQANYIPICTVVADNNIHVSTITDNRPNLINFLDLNKVFSTNLFSAFVLTGLTASKDGATANKLNVTSGIAFLLQLDGMLREKDIPSNSFTTNTVSTTYYLDLNPDGTYSFGTSHSVKANYMPICSLTTDNVGNINIVTDQATRNANLLPSLSSASVQLAGTSVTTVDSTVYDASFLPSTALAPSQWVEVGGYLYFPNVNGTTVGFGRIDKTNLTAYTAMATFTSVSTSPYVYGKPMYDGNDSIYLCMACGGNTTVYIEKYSISQNTWTQVGSYQASAYAIYNSGGTCGFDGSNFYIFYTDSNSGTAGINAVKINTSGTVAFSGRITSQTVSPEVHTAPYVTGGNVYQLTNEGHIYVYTTAMTYSSTIVTPYVSGQIGGLVQSLSKSKLLMVVHSSAEFGTTTNVSEGAGIGVLDITTGKIINIYWEPGNPVTFNHMILSDSSMLAWGIYLEKATYNNSILYKKPPRKFLAGL